MDYSSLPILKMLYSMGLFGTAIGLMVGFGSYDVSNKREIWYWMAGGTVLFAFLGWLIVAWQAKKTEENTYYESTAETVMPQQPPIQYVLMIRTEGKPDKFIYGLSDKQWIALGQGIKKYDYQFTVPICKHIFRKTEWDGYDIYQLVRNPLEKDEVLKTNSKGGYDVVDKSVIDSLAAGDWEVIERKLPSPTV